MNIGQKVICIDGGGYLEDGGSYTIKNITRSGNLLLVEAKPPFPFTSFDRNRFITPEEDTDIQKLVEYDLFYNQPT
jgi:hypothetical protein